MKNIGIIGAGTMGNGIAHVSALAGFNIVLLDVNEDLLKRGLETIQNNLYRQLKKRKITKISRSLGINSKFCFGNDVSKVFKETNIAISFIKKENKPYFLEFSTYRMVEHCGPLNDDHLGYRKIQEIEYWKKRCPIETYKKKLLKEKLINEDYILNYKKKCIKEINKSFDFAYKSKFPSKKILKQHIYA